MDLEYFNSENRGRVTTMARIAGYQQAHRRRDRRTPTISIRVVVDGRVYDALDFGFGGFSVGDYQRWGAPGDRVTVQAIGLGEGRSVPLNLKARIIRVDPTHATLACAFDDLDGTTFDIIQEIVTRPAWRRAAGGELRMAS